MAKTEWNPGTLLQLSGSYWQTCTLHTGVKLEIFTLLEKEKATGKELARKTGMPERSLTMLLDALAAMALLSKEKGCYRTTRAAASFLSKNAPG